MSPPFFKGVTLVITVLALCFQLANTQPPAHEMLQGATNITFSERPGYYQEFKMNVAASTQECFYERLIEGTSLTCIFQVSQCNICLRVLAVSEIQKKNQGCP